MCIDTNNVVLCKLKYIVFLSIFIITNFVCMYLQINAVGASTYSFA